MKTLTREQRNAVYKRAVEISSLDNFAMDDDRIMYNGLGQNLINAGLCIVLKYAHLDIYKEMNEYPYWDVENIFQEFKDLLESGNYVHSNEYRLNALNKMIELTS